MMCNVLSNLKRQDSAFVSGDFIGTKGFGPFIPHVIIAFRKKDGGISGCGKKERPKTGTFF
jgi:hypothetical protein